MDVVIEFGNLGFYKEIILPFGIQSTQMHINYWDEEYLNNFDDQ